MQPHRRLAANIRRIRLEAGWSQVRVAADAKLQVVHLSRIELARANPTLDVLVRISRALAVDISALFEPVDPRAPAPPELKRGKPVKRKQTTSKASSSR